MVTSTLVPPPRRSSASSPSRSASGDDGTGRIVLPGRRCQGSRLAWCSPAKPITRTSSGSATASRLIASVVLRVMTTASSSRAPTKRRIDSRAPSYAAVAARDLNPAPRWTLEYQPSSSFTASATLDQGGGGGRVVEVEVAALATGHQRHHRVRADEAQAGPIRRTRDTAGHPRILAPGRGLDGRGTASAHSPPGGALPTLAAMNDLDAILAAAAACDARGEPYALATVIAVRGSSYRRPGARLLVPAQSAPVGIVSGGCLEDEAARLAREALERGVPVAITIDHSTEGDEVWGSGLGCRGVIDLVAEPPRLAAQTAAALRAARDDGRATYLLTTLAGERRSLTADDARELADVASGRPQRTGDGVIDVILPPPHLVICGAGPDAPPLVALAAALGWRVTVADSRRRRLADAALDPAARCDAPAAEAAARIGPAGVSAVVVMSHNLLRDAEFLGGFAGHGIRYLGVLGPRDRTDRILGELVASGHPLNAADRAALHAPAGIDLGADGPDEVALAIVAEILGVLRAAGGGPLRDRSGPIHPPM